MKHYQQIYANWNEFDPHIFCPLIVLMRRRRHIMDGDQDLDWMMKTKSPMSSRYPFTLLKVDGVRYSRTALPKLTSCRSFRWIRFTIAQERTHSYLNSSTSYARPPMANTSTSSPLVPANPFASTKSSAKRLPPSTLTLHQENLLFMSTN